MLKFVEEEDAWKAANYIEMNQSPLHPVVGEVLQVILSSTERGTFVSNAPLLETNK